MLSIFFGVITSWTQDAPSAVKIAQGIQRQNGFELWRLLWREYHPEQTNKSLIWRRTLLSPKFPTREADFSAAFQEWENDVDRYAAEFGAERAIADENKRALLITESPVALKQHLAMHAATLTTYEQVRAVVVSYLQAKRVWIPTATYAAGHTARARDPDAMNVDKIDDKKGKGKGKQEKGKKGEGKRKGDGKKSEQGEHGKNTAKNEEREKCAICWRNHSTQECWYNAKGQGKQSKDGTSGKGRGEHPIHQRQKHVHCSHVSRPFRLPRGHPRWEWRIGEIRDPSRLRSRTCNANREKTMAIEVPSNHAGTLCRARHTKQRFVSITGQ
jgi:hypothetical protein